MIKLAVRTIDGSQVFLDLVRPGRPSRPLFRLDLLAARFLAAALYDPISREGEMVPVQLCAEEVGYHYQGPPPEEDCDA